MSWRRLITALRSKAEILSDTVLPMQACKNISNADRIQLALQHYDLCDSVLTYERTASENEDDDYELAEDADIVYAQAAELCAAHPQLFEKSFYFSEKNKAAVLLKTIASNEWLNQTVSDSILQLLSNLKNELVVFEEKKLNSTDENQSSFWNSQLFDTKQKIKRLISEVESKNPDFYLQKNVKTVSIELLQNKLKRKSIIISFFVTKESILVYVIGRGYFNIFRVKKTIDLNSKILEIRNAIQTPTEEAVRTYVELADLLYRELFPEKLRLENIFTQAESITIIPDELLTTLPFEALHFEPYLSNWISWKDTAFFSKMPFLIKKFPISYSYSSTLLYQTNLRNKNHKLKYPTAWLAFAPVFDDENTAGTTELTREMLAYLDTSLTDSATEKRTLLSDGSYIAPIPGSLEEVRGILKMYENSGKPAQIFTHQQANEANLVNVQFSNPEVVHFATHGVVNSYDPELSGLLFAQYPESNIIRNIDISGNALTQNDGMFYRSEIMNMRLNCNLAVLSACETGLGKVTQGEGVVGLTHAFIYSGVRNVMVSLWQVSDESTTNLMLSFYQIMLKKYNSRTYNRFLQLSKLRMIEKGAYAHPYYWIPFVLIGQ